MSLRSIETGAEAPPYPEDIKTNGWRFDLDTERLRASDTWALALPDQRPWLLMLWVTAWDSIPAGTLPADDAVIAARMGLAFHTFRAWREVLMRGWWRATNGLYYHRTITQSVLQMLDRRKKEAERQAAWRARKYGAVTRDIPVTNAGQTGESHVNTTPTPTVTVKKEKKKTPLAPRSKNPEREAADVVITIFSNRGEEIPIYRDFVEELEKAYPDVDPIATLHEIRAWSIANPRKRKTADGMKRHINSWFKKDQNDG